MKNYIGIDPSTSTGFVRLNAGGAVEAAIEIKSEHTDAARIVDLASQVIGHIDSESMICIEGFSHGSKGSAVDFQYGLGWCIRTELYKRRWRYVEVAPSALKKFASGKHNAGKDDLILPIYKQWGFEHGSNDVRDAFVLSQIARALEINETKYAYQAEVIRNIRKAMG